MQAPFETLQTHQNFYLIVEWEDEPKSFVNSAVLGPSTLETNTPPVGVQKYVAEDIIERARDIMERTSANLHLLQETDPVADTLTSERKQSDTEVGSLCRKELLFMKAVLKTQASPFKSSLA